MERIRALRGHALLVRGAGAGHRPLGALRLALRVVDTKQTELSHALHVPYVCLRMILASPMKDFIVDFAKRATHEWGTQMGSDPCLSMSREALAWLENLDTTDISDHGHCAVTLQATADVHDSQA